MTGCADCDSFTVYCDNQSAISLARNPVQHQRSKHIDIKYHLERSEVQKNVLHLMYLPTDQNLADMFTKPVSKAKLQQFIDAMRISKF